MKKLKLIPMMLVLFALLGLVPGTALADTTEDGDWTYYNYGTYIYLTKYQGEGGAVEIPAEIDGLPVTKLNYKFIFSSSGSTVTSITIPASITDFTNRLFTFCTSLTEIIVDSENTIFMSQDGVLFDKAGTTLVSFPQGRSGIYEISSGVTTLGEDAFYQCIGLTGITLPDGLEVMGESAFQYCSGLTSITIPYGVTLLDEYTFSDCTNLREVNLPNSLTTINNRAFQNCEKLTEITIPYSVTCINSYAFNNHNTALLIRGVPGSVAEEFATTAGIDFEAVGIDEMPPILTAGTSERTSLEQAVVTFTTNEVCEYYYAVVEDGADQPELDTTVDGTACTAGEVAFTVTDLTSGAKDVYIVAKDADDMVSTILVMEIHEYDDITPPVLSDASWSRTSYTEATVTFTAN